MLVKQPQKKPHEDNHGGKDDTHDVPTPPQEPQREAEAPKTARAEINAREKFERRKRAEKRSRETCRRPPKPADAGGSGAAPFQNFPYVFVLFHNYDLFFMPYGPRLPCFRFCGLYFRGAEYTSTACRGQMADNARKKGRTRIIIAWQMPVA